MSVSYMRARAHKLNANMLVENERRADMSYQRCDIEEIRYDVILRINMINLCYRVIRILLIYQLSLLNIVSVESFSFLYDETAYMAYFTQHTMSVCCMMLHV